MIRMVSIFVQNHPFKWYIYPHEWLIFVVNVGKYAIDGFYGFVQNHPLQHCNLDMYIVFQAVVSRGSKPNTYMKALWIRLI